MRARDDGVVPRQPGSGEGQRDRRHRGQHFGLDALGPQHPDRPEQARVAAGQDDRLAVVLAGSMGHRPHIANDHPAGHPECGQVPLPTGNQGRGVEPGPGLRRQRRAVDPQHGHATHDASVAATQRAPAGSTSATRAVRPENRVSTSATAVHNRSPHARSTPACSHSS